MKVVQDASSFEWIKVGRQLVPPGHSSGGVPLAGLIPLTFEQYAKVLHRFEVSEDRQKSLTQDELAILQIPDCAAIKSLVASRQRGTRIVWKEAAAALDVPYSQEITHG